MSRHQKGKPIWILLKQETVSSCGISWAICKSAHPSRQITTPAPHHSGRIPFLPPDQRPTAWKHWSRVDIKTTIQSIGRGWNDYLLRVCVCVCVWLAAGSGYRGAGGDWRGRRTRQWRPRSTGRLLPWLDGHARPRRLRIRHSLRLRHFHAGYSRRLAGKLLQSHIN